MISVKHINSSKFSQYILSVTAVLVVSGIGFAISGWVGYRVTALLLLVTVSLLAMFVGIGSVLVASLLSALIWDFFFIPPRFTFHIGTAEDALLLLMYFIISLVTGVLTLRIRQMERHQREKEDGERTIKLYNTLLNSLSHELRTPIATIIAATDHIQYNFRGMNDNEMSEVMEEVSIASMRLNMQVENLLNMSRLESGFVQPRKDWCDIQDLVYGTVNRMSDVLNGHRIDIEIEDEMPLFKLDYGLAEQILYNLIINAVNYTPTGTLISLKAACEYNSCVLTVTDEGPGFPIGEMSRVFDKFYRLDEQKAGGSGLGLSIVKGFAEALGGTVCLSNKEPHGAVFTIDLPCETTYINVFRHE